MKNPQSEHAAPPDEQWASPALAAADGGAAVLSSSCPPPLGSLASPPAGPGSWRICPPHHWNIGQPKKGRISGVCRHCGESGEWSAILDLDAPLRGRRRNKGQVDRQKLMNTAQRQQGRQQRPWKYESPDG